MEKHNIKSKKEKKNLEEKGWLGLDWEGLYMHMG